MRRLQYLAIAMLPLLFVGCGGAGNSNGTEYQDTQGLITFSVPDNWALRNESNGMRFGSAANQREPTTLAIIPKQVGAEFSLEQKIKTGKAQIRQQDAEVLNDKTVSINGFSAWEAVYQIRNQTAHSIEMLADNISIQVILISKSELYASYVSDLMSVVNSIEVN